MKRTTSLVLAICLGTASWLHSAEPMTFRELSLMIRTGVPPQEIVNDAARRKLLEPLTAEQAQSLRDSGASPALLNALHTPTLVATPQEAAAYRARHQAAPPTGLATALPPPPPDGGAKPAPLQAVVLPDRFTEGLEAAKSVPQHPVKTTDAFSFTQLAEAKAEAQRARKPLGFVMMSATMLDKPATTRDPGGSSALLHFCEAFKNSLVLVFVPLETKEEDIPPAILAGFKSKEMGGVAPNMTVVDATANALIVAVPCGNNKTAGPDRDKIFAVAAAVIQRWLSYHPMAIVQPAAVAPAGR